MKRKATTVRQVKELGVRQGWKCNVCRAFLKSTFEVDHVVPLCRGGTNDTSNLQALCVECHSAKTREDLLSSFDCTYVVCGKCHVVYSPYFHKSHRCTAR